jgi:hypothetical protein
MGRNAWITIRRNFMPQYARKTRQMAIIAGVKPPIYADKLYDSSGNFLSKTQYISKGLSGAWPGAGWHIASASVEEVPQEETEQKENTGKIKF